MRKLALALALAASAALAGGAEPQPLFPFADSIIKRYGGPTVPFVVDVDFSRSKTFASGSPIILMTVVQPSGDVVNLSSRPMRPGEKVRWEGQIPATGTSVLHVVNQSSVSSSFGPVRGKITLMVTGDAQGNLNRSGSCDMKKPRTPGICTVSEFSF